MRILKRVIFFLLFLSNAVFGGAGSKTENQVKALFIFNFANYVTWPDEAFASPQSAIDVCIFGEERFTPYLLSFEGVLIGDHSFRVLQSTDIDDVKGGCHILFVSEKQRIRLPDFWNRIEYMYVLSIGEKSEFAEKGGIISVFRTEDQVQFDVNISNAIRNGLFLDSDLLALARTIKRHSK